MDTHDQIEVRLLGPTLIRRRNGEITSPKEWRTTKCLDLVRLLALSDGRAVGCTVLTDRLWPNAAPEKAQASLRTAAYHARQVLGDDAIERVGDGLALRDAWTDVKAFANLAKEVELARRAGRHLTVAALARDADALYVHDIEADSSSDWLVEAQQQCRVQRLEVLLAAAESAVELGHMRGALELAASAAQVEPCSERAVRVTMRAHGALGEMEKALGAFERLRSELVDQYGVDPAPQTRALYVQLLAGPGSDAQDGSDGRAVGSDKAVDALRDALGRARAGGVVWVVGERSGRAGVIRAACAAAGVSLRRTSMPVEQIADLPAVRNPLHADDVVVTPEAPSLTPHDAGRLRDWAVSRKVTLVVPTSERNAAALRTVAALSGERDTVMVDALTRSGVEPLLESLLQGVPAPSLVRAVVERTGGRPDAVRTWVRDALRRGVVMWAPEGLVLHEGAVRSLFPAAPGGLLRSLGSLEFGAVEALAAVAVVGRPVLASDVDAVFAGLHRDHAGHAQRLLTLLVDTGRLRSTPDGFEMRTDQDRDELIAWLRPAEVRRMHAVVARELRLEPADRARHLLAAGEHQLAHEVTDGRAELLASA
jgi:DNA-binding SARP family transcriptional activator